MDTLRHPSPWQHDHLKAINEIGLPRGIVTHGRNFK